jgi:hypothetical protein
MKTFHALHGERPAEQWIRLTRVTRLVLLWAASDYVCLELHAPFGSQKRAIISTIGGANHTMFPKRLRQSQTVWIAI